MKVCYCDESGTGSEPIAVMAAVVVDSTRMHVTKDEWAELLVNLSAIAGKKIDEIHTRHFYKGSGVWHGIKGSTRSKVISSVFDWFCERKHHVIFSAAIKTTYFENLKAKKVPDELNTIWRFLGFHLILAAQKGFKSLTVPKGHTIFVFDNEEREQLRFKDLVNNPPKWSHDFYDKHPKKEPLDLIVDAPYFGDSREVALIQVADFIAYFLRRYAELEEGLSRPTYVDEKEKVRVWARQVLARSIGVNHLYPARPKTLASQLYIDHAPKCLMTEVRSAVSPQL